MKRLASSSIRRDLLAWLLIPLGLLGIIGTGFAYYLSIAFANDAYDRELLNSLDSVAVRTRRKSGHILVDLPPYVRNLLRHDNSDRSFYRIANDVGEPILGDPEMPPPPGDLSLASPHFSNGTIRDAKVRIVSLRIPVSEKETARTGDSVIVQVAETLKARERFAQQLLVSMVLPQLLMIALGGICIWLGVGRGLRSLQILQEAIARRSQFELKPVSVEKVPVEVRPLVMAINDLLERLREDLESQRRFVANAAHQLRTPLAGLKTYIGVIHALDISQEAHQGMEQVDQALNRVTHMVNRLLALAKAEPNSAMAVEHKHFDLNDLAAEATSELVLEALKKEIDLAYEGIEDRAGMIGDPSSLRELIMNLVDNAIRYTPKGGHVTVRLDNSKTDLVALTVEDDGPGIPPEEREHIFERFYRVLGTQVPGTGLGLAIVREIARAHSASIEVLAGVNNTGTRFVVNFPRNPAAS